MNAIFVGHTDTIDIERHLNESKVHLNISGPIEFAKNVCEFLLQQDWYSTDNSCNISLGSEKSSTVLGVSNSIPENNIHFELSQLWVNSNHKSVREDQIFKEPHEVLPELRKALKNIRRKNINRLTFTQFNIHSLWNKFESLQSIQFNSIQVTKILMYFWYLKQKMIFLFLQYNSYITSGHKMPVM